MIHPIRIRGEKMETRNDLPPEIQAVISAFKKHDISHRLLLFQPEQTKTSPKAAKAIGCQLSQICKSIALITEDQEPLIVMTAGDNRINLERMSKYLGKKVRLMKPREVKQYTGFEVGGVPPLGHQTKISMYMDEDLLKHEKIYAAGGTANSIIETNPHEIQKATKAVIIAVK